MANIGYILKSDMLAVTTEKTLREITGGREAIGDNPVVPGNDEIWKKNVPTALEITAGYIRHWYDADTELAPFFSYDLADEYTAGQRIYDEDNETAYVCILDAPAGTDLTNETYFTQEDNRNAVLVECVAVLTLYNTFRRENPRSMPEQRQTDHDNTMKVLRDIQTGKITLKIAERTEVESDDPGQDVAYGEFDDEINYNY